jgi:hypothetical protein
MIITIKHVQGMVFDVFHDSFLVKHTWMAGNGNWFECPAGADGEVKPLPQGAKFYG